MQEALDNIIYIFSSFISLLFNFYIFENVSIGMVFIVVFIFSLLIGSILNIPNRLGISIINKSRYKKGSDENG